MKATTDAERVEQIAAFPTHESHGEPGWVTMHVTDRDMLVQGCRHRVALLSALIRLLGFVVGEAHVRAIIDGEIHPEHGGSCSVCVARMAIRQAEGR